MTTRDFIARTFGVSSTRERQCSSVFADYDGNVYSYGYHYPLVFQVAGHNFINNAGYSTTTAKHISWAWSAVGYNATAVQLDREASRAIATSWYTDDEKLQHLERVTRQAVERALEACNAKKRKDTQVYRWLADTLGRAEASHIAVNNLIDGRA